MESNVHEAGTADIDTQLGEQYYRGRKEEEERLTKEIIDVVHKYIEKRHQQGRRPALRDAHAKDNGIVRAKFQVDSYLAPKLQQGVFVPGATYDAWVRFSNGNSERRSDRWPDARGMAIKLLDVEGPKLSPDEQATQDFILINSPAFFVDDLERYKETLEQFLSENLLVQYLSVFKLEVWREIWLAIKANRSLITNPLFSQYWSTTPYRLGVEPATKTAIKFTAKPSALERPHLLRRWATWFAPGFSLKTQLYKALSAERVFDFYLQLFVDDECTPVENTTIEWTESVSPPIHVARIIIPPQRQPDAAGDYIRENFSFSPWHCLEAHKPLGVINRVRRCAYLKNSEHRHKLNKAKMAEPPPAVDNVGDS